MKALSANIKRALPVGATLTCADNSGAKIVEIINVLKYKGVLRRVPTAGVGSIIICSVKKGTPAMRKKKVKAIVVRQKAAYKRANGTTVVFEDNAAVLIEPKKGIPVATEIKGVIAREVAEIYPKIAAIAAGVA
ncbi:50S ribosomal protein L14 [Candidatus Micrarchaeota archaeon]|nr:50S ribosomal protein L14 [Candidatus Micrarchaeota archaeon]